MGVFAESEAREWSPLVSIRFSLSMENEWADEGRDGRTRLVTPNSQVRKGTGKQTKSY